MNFFAFKQLSSKKDKENTFPKVFFSNREKNTNNNKGFTLIELLVVIAIIGILATLAIVSLTTARSSSRDAKRIADLKQLQTALELYYNDYGSYPTVLSDLSSTTKYLETIPTAPTPADGDCTATSNSYIYNTSYDRSSYSIHTCIGGNTSSLTKGLVVASQNGLSSWKCGENFLDERDGNSYKTIQFGSQCWFAQNLAYLPEVEGNDATFVSKGNNTPPVPAYGVYGYHGSDVAAAKATANYKIYGVHYNWFAAVNSSLTDGSAEGGQGACPVGWHVPTSTEFTTLYNTINNETKYRCDAVSGRIGKSMASPFNWVSNTTVCAAGNNQQTNNSTGFNGLPAGCRYTSGAFYDLGYYTFFWSSSFSNPNALSRYLIYNSSSFHSSSYSPVNGLSVRCLKN